MSFRKRRHHLVLEELSLADLTYKDIGKKSSTKAGLSVFVIEMLSITLKLMKIIFTLITVVWSETVPCIQVPVVIVPFLSVVVLYSFSGQQTRAFNARSVSAKLLVDLSHSSKARSYQ
jgi:hypothetical protein